MKTEVEITRVPLAVSLTVACPTCEAQPGASCRYMHDLLKGRQVVHERGKRMRSVHNARAGVVKAQWRAEYQAQQADGRRRLDAEMAALYESGKALEEVAVFAVLNAATVRRRLSEAGVAIRGPGSGRPGRRNPERDGRIAAAYAAGSRPREIADREGISCMTVYNALRREGVVLRRTEVTS